MKKCLCLMLIVFLIVSTCVQSIAAGEPEHVFYRFWDHLNSSAKSWYHVYNDSPATFSNDDTAGNFHQGKSSLKVDNTSGSSFTLATLTSDFIGEANMGETYRCVFWVKTENLSANSLYFYPNYRTEDERVLVPEGTAGWTRYETTLLVNEQYKIGEYVTAFVFQGAGIVWIDEVSMQKINVDGTYGHNILTNPYFEQKDFYTGTVDPDSYECNDTETVPYWTVSTATATYDMDARIVSDVHNGGGNSLRITNNMGCVPYIYLRLYQPYDLNGITTGVDYTYSFWIKSENQHKGDMNFGPSVGKSRGINDEICGTKDWQQITGTWNPGNDWDNFNFHISSGSSGTIWIDDVVVKKATDPEGTNYLQNPGFEATIEQERSDVSNITVDVNANLAEISWTNPVEDYRFAGTKIYKITDGYKALITDLGKDISQYTVDSEGKYVITTYGKYSIPDVPKNGYLNSPGVTFDVNIVDFRIDEAYIKIDGIKSANLTEGTAKPGILLVSKDSRTVTIALALYDGDKLADCVFENVNITGKPNTQVVSTVNSLTIPDLTDGNYSAKIFVFENDSNIKPLLKNITPIIPQAN